MCLAIPGKILSIDPSDQLMRMGRVDFGGIIKEVSLAYTPEAVISDYILAHVGFAITIIDEQKAMEVFNEISR